MKLPFFSRLRAVTSAALPAPVTLVPPIAAAAADSTASSIPDLTAAAPAADSQHLNTIASLTSERDMLRAQLDQVNQSATEAAARLTAAEASIATLTEKLTFAETAAAQTREEITQKLRQQELATLAASQGIPAADIVPAQSEAAPMSHAEKVADFERRLAAATTPTERFKIGQEARAALMPSPAKKRALSAA